MTLSRWITIVAVASAVASILSAAAAGSTIFRRSE